MVPAAMARAATHLDCNWNMGKTSITANALPWLKYFRQNGHAKTPLVLAEDAPPAGGKWLLPATHASMEAKRGTLRAAFVACKSALVIYM